MRWFCIAKKASGESPTFPDKGRTRPNNLEFKIHLVNAIKKAPTNKC